MNDNITIEQARVAKERMKKLLADSSVPSTAYAVGISRQEGTKTRCVKVNLSEPIITTEFPTEIDGVPIVWKVVGSNHKL